MPTYEKAPEQVNSLLKKVMEKYHGGLHEAGVTVDVLMAFPTMTEDGESLGPPLKIKGYPCAAIVKSNSLKNRVAGLGDAEICIDADQWKVLSDAQKEALMDHELAHLEVKKDKDEQIVFDDHARPKLRTRPHDKEVGWFDEVARRHGKAAIEFSAFDAIWQSCRQLNMPFLDEIG